MILPMWVLDSSGRLSVGRLLFFSGGKGVSCVDHWAATAAGRPRGGPGTWDSNRRGFTFMARGCGGTHGGPGDGHPFFALHHTLPEVEVLPFEILPGEGRIIHQAGRPNASEAELGASCKGARPCRG